MQKLKNCAPPEFITRAPGHIPDQVRLAVQQGSSAPVVVVVEEVDHVTASTPPAVITERTLPAASEPSPNLPAVDYKPTRRDEAYLSAVQQILTKDGRVTDVAIAEIMGVDKSRCSQLRKKAGFRAWLRLQLMSGIEDKWPQMLERAAELATRGSIDHLNFVAKVRGEFKDGNLQPGAERGLHVHLHV